MKKLASLVILLFCAAAFAQSPPRIAVYVTGNVGEDEKKALGTRMLASLINSKRYKGIERSNSFLAEIEKEQEKQRSGEIDDSQISQLGRQFGVKFVCIADITPVYGEFQVSARIVDVETAEVVFIGEAFSPMKTTGDLARVSDQVVRNMFSEEAKPEPKPEPAAVSPQKTEPPKTYTITVNVNPFYGGAVSRNPQKTAYAAGEQVTLNAKANKGYTFVNWAGTAASAQNDIAITVTADSNLTLSANFQLEPNPEPSAPKPKPKPEFKISAGGRAVFVSGFGGGIEWETSREAVAMPYNAIGAQLFFDAVYAEALVGFSTGGGKLTSGNVTEEYLQNAPDIQRTYINIGAFAKYPFAAGIVKAFPLVGFEYDASVSGKLVDAKGNEYKFDGGNGRPKAGNLSAAWFRFGAGADINIGENEYLRAEFLYGLRTENAYEKELATQETNYYDHPASARGGHGITLKVGAGVKF